jgi:hypothetical protein
VHALGAQRAHQAFPKHAARHRAEERHRLAQPRQPDRDVEGRAADARVHGHAGGRVVRDEHVHQRLAADDDHAITSSAGSTWPATRPPSMLRSRR